MPDKIKRYIFPQRENPSLNDQGSAMLNHFLSRIRKILPAALIAASVPIMLSGSEVAGTIIKVQELLKQKDYQTAKTLIAKSLKSNQDSW